MARNNTHRYELSGMLEALTPLHVGGYGHDPDTDLPLARNGRGEWYIPGTSLAGAIRAWSEASLDKAYFNELWGFQNEDAREGESKGHASFITIADAVLSNLVVPEIRDGVGIDRYTGAAATHIKYDRAVLPRGTRFPLCVRAEVADNPERALAFLAAMQDALKNEGIRFGAAKTRGLGRVKLVDDHLKQATLNTKQGILAFLKNGCATVANVPRMVFPPAPRLTATITWKPQSPTMVKAGFDGIAVDMLPLVSHVLGGITPVLPGSSIKGAFRSRAEMLVRTLRNTDTAKRPTNSRQAFLYDTDVELVNDLFGARGCGNQTAHANGDHLGQGALSIDDCFAEQTLTLEEWKQIAYATLERDLWQTLDKQKRPWQQAMHVAIDRWTGGAAESFLYSVLEPHAVEWRPIEITLSLERLPDAIRPLGVGLLFQVLRDLTARRIPLGFATNRGMGDISVTGIQLHATGTEAERDGLPTGTYELIRDHHFTIPDASRSVVTKKWTAWLNRGAHQ